MASDRYWYEQCEGCGEEVRYVRGPRDGRYLCATCRRAHTRAKRRQAEQARAERTARATYREPRAGERCGRCGDTIVWDRNGFALEHASGPADHAPIAPTETETTPATPATPPATKTAAETETAAEIRTSREIADTLMCRLERVTYAHADGRPAIDELEAIGRDVVDAWAFMNAQDADRVYERLRELEHAAALLQRDRETETTAETETAAEDRETAAEDRDRATETITAPGPFKLILTGPEGITEHEFDQPAVTIGRDPRCDLIIDDETVSRRHAEILRHLLPADYPHGPTFAVSVHPTANGTCINGRSVREMAIITPGDDVRIAEKFTLRLETAERGR